MEVLMQTEALVPAQVSIPIGGGWLQAELTTPPHAMGLVIFAHGSGSSRHSPRNQFVARELQAHGLATLLADLLTPPEERADQYTGQWRFDIALLGRRVNVLIDWARTQAPLADLPIGLFGASTGAAAALLAAAERPDHVSAVVSRGGRPDLAAGALARVHAPTLLLVGERDEEVIALNRQAMARMTSAVRLEIVPGATHLFEEEGALEHVATRAAEWFTFQLPRHRPAAAERAATGG